MKINANKISLSLFFLISILVFIRPFISEMAYPILGSYIRLIILTIFLLCLIGIKKFDLLVKPFSWPILLYLVSVCASLFYSINIRSSLYQIYQLMPLLCLFTIASNLEKKETQGLVKFMLIAALILSLYAIYQYIWGFEYTKTYLHLHLKDMLQTRYAREILMTRRAIATFFSPNIFASYLAMAIPISLGSLMHNKKNKRPFLFFAACLVFMLIALALTKSLAGWTGLLLGIPVFLFFIRHAKKNKILAICTIFIVLILLFLLLGRYNMFINFSNQQNTILQRLGFWRNTFRIIKDFTFTGVGAGNLSNIYLSYKDFVQNETMFSHNIFLQTWAETGLLGLTSIILLVLAFVKTSLRIERNFFNAGIVSACSVFIINNLFDYSYFIPQVSFFWWISMGIVSQGSGAPKEKPNNKIRTLVLFVIIPMIYLNTRSLIALNYFKNTEYKKAIAAEPYNDVYYAAMKDYNKAISLNPYFPFYHKESAILYLNSNMTKNAISEFEKALSLYPSSIAFRQRLFDLYTKAEEFEKAEKQKLEIQRFHSEYSGYFIR